MYLYVYTYVGMYVSLCKYSKYVCTMYIYMSFMLYIYACIYVYEYIGMLVCIVCMYKLNTNLYYGKISSKIISCIPCAIEAKPYKIYDQNLICLD